MRNVSGKNAGGFFLGWETQGLLTRNTSTADWRNTWKTVTPAEERILEAVVKAGGGDLGLTWAQRPNDPEYSPHRWGYAIDFSLKWIGGNERDLKTLPLFLKTFYTLANTWQGGVGIAIGKNLHLHVDDRLLLFSDTVNGKVALSANAKQYWSQRSRGFPYAFVEDWSTGSLRVETYSPAMHDAILLSTYGLPKAWLDDLRDSFKQTISDTADDVGQWIDNRFDAILPDAGFGWGVFIGLGLSAAGLYAWHKHGPGLAKAVPLIVDAARTRKMFRIKKKAG